MTGVHVVVPNDIDDPMTPSGGNAYDRRVCRGLAASGWSVREYAIPGAWPQASATERADLARVLTTLPHDSVVLLDGLIASTVPDILIPHVRRLRLVVLVHMPLGDQAAETRSVEREALSAAFAVVTTSSWSRRRLLDLYSLPADRVHVAQPGVDAAPLARGSVAGSELLCVGAVTSSKGHDLLVEALATIADVPWTCVCVGPLGDAGFAELLRRRTRAHGIANRIRFVGPCTGPDLEARYAAADLLVLASRGDAYGMVVAEALAHGIPVLTTTANGLPEALGRAPDRSLPGILVQPGDTAALAGALRRWLAEPDLRYHLKQSARDRRTTLTGWATTVALISNVLSGIATNVSTGR